MSCGVIQVCESLSWAIGVAQDAVDVFSAEDGGSALVDDPGDVGPDPSFVARAAAVTRAGMRLARPARSNAIHESVEGSCIESHDIAEDFCSRETAPEPACRLRVVLDSGDASVGGEDGLDGEVKHADSGAEGEAIHATS